MENRRRGRAPGSGRPSSRFNPITGVDYEEDDRLNASRNNNVNTKEDVGIPTLNLGVLEDRERRVPTHQGHMEHKLNPPSPTSTISWGTTNDTARSLYSNRLDELADQLVDSVPLTPAAPRDDDVIDSRWTSAPYHHSTQEKITDAAYMEEKKMREKVLETVMVDQLSRAVISEPSQDSGRSGDGDRLYHQPGQARGAIRRLHQSKVKTTGTATEQLLSQRVRFGARILSRVGSDAVRELTGFFFYAENSLTIYEYKQFGRTSKALPLLARGSYNHITGRRKGMPYTLADIRLNNTLYFSVGGQNYLPETTRQKEMLAIRICDVDEEAKADIILSGVRQSDHSRIWNEFHELTESEYHDLAVTKSVQEKIQSMLKKRGVRTITGLSAHFRQSDRTNDGVLDRFELEQALKDYHIVLSQQEFDCMWSVVDMNKDGVLDYGEFLRNFVGEMSEYRKTFVRKAFHKMDPQRKGEIDAALMKKFFNAAKHPWVRSGQISEIGLTEQFLASWTHCCTPELISYPEFEEYYEGLSLGVEDDEEFVNILKNCWGL